MTQSQSGDDRKGDVVWKNAKNFEKNNRAVSMRRFQILLQSHECKASNLGRSSLIPNSASVEVRQ